MMRRKTLFWLMIACVALSTGCVTASSLSENRQISQRLHKDMADFYDNMAQAYYLLGYEYYKLYKEASDMKNEAAAKQYYNNSVIYKQYYDDLKASVDLMRRTSALPKFEETMQPAPPAPSSPGLTDSATTQAKVVRIKPEAQKPPVEETPAVESPAGGSEQKPSLLQRLGLRRKAVEEQPQPPAEKR